MRILLVLLLVSFAACTSSGSSRSSTTAADGTTAPRGEAIRMTVRDYRSSARFELVSQALVGALEQYSTLAPDASRKVQDDELMTALRDYLEGEGWSELAQRGKAPELTDGAKAWTLEVEDARGARFVLATPETPKADMQRMRALLDAVLATYNETQGWQAVDIKARTGEDYFQRQQPTVKKP